MRGPAPEKSGPSRPGVPSALGRRLPLALLGLLAWTGACGEEEVEAPAPLFEEMAIEYPLDLWDAGVEGTTVIRVRVDTAGVVDSAAVLEPSGHPAFDSAAVAGVRELRFRPGRRDGEPVPVWAEIPVQFSKDSIP